MNGNHRYEVRGTEALACRYERGSSRNVIDYDIARRSYEARQRLARRQQRAQVPACPSQRKSERLARKQEYTFADVVESEYTPGRTSVDAIGGILRQAKSSIVNHPFWWQLRDGTLKGIDTGKATYRQVLNTSTICLAVSMVLVFLGA